MTHVTSLSLHSFRNYEHTALTDLPAGPVVLHGPNGIGKTNVLEALSLLTPGRGLRGAKSEALQRFSSLPETQSWAISATLDTPWGDIRIGTGASSSGGPRRAVRINGADANQAALAEYLSCVWLTPQMDRLFLDGASARRRFLDRLVFAFDPGHAGRVTRYEKTLRERAILLKGEAAADPLWLDALESGMAETGVAIAAARSSFAERLQGACDSQGADEGADPFFPRAVLSVDGEIETALSRMPAVEAEDWMRAKLRQSRTGDALRGGAETGPHKSDLQVSYAAKNIAAAQCSTGEQKALLIGMILAHAHLIKSVRGAPSVLLLDEIGAHLDEKRRSALYDLLCAAGGQVWLTGTDKALFHGLDTKARVIEVGADHTRLEAA